MKRFLYLGVSGSPEVARGGRSPGAWSWRRGSGHDRRRRVDACPKSKPIPARVMVDAVRPRRATLHRNIEQPGQIEAFERTALYSKIPGFVERYHLDIGDRVRKGQLLAECWVPEVVEELHQKEANVTEDEALIVQGGMLRVAEAKVDPGRRHLSAGRRRAAPRPRRPGPGGSRSIGGSRGLGPGALPAGGDGTDRREAQDVRRSRLRGGRGGGVANAALVKSKAQRNKAAADVRSPWRDCRRPGGP